MDALFTWIVKRKKGHYSPLGYAAIFTEAQEGWLDIVTWYCCQENWFDELHLGARAWISVYMERHICSLEVESGIYKDAQP